MDVLSKCDKIQFKTLLYNIILGNSANSLLFQNVREKASLAYSIKSVYVKQKANIFIRAGIEIENYEKAVKIIKEQLENMKKGTFSEEDLKSAKENVKARYQCNRNRTRYRNCILYRAGNLKNEYHSRRIFKKYRRSYKR